MTDQEKYDVKRTIKFIENVLATVDHPRQLTVILVSLEESGFLKTSYDLNVAVNNHFFPVKK